MSLRKISDPTGLGIDDIKKKIIRTPLPSRITLRDDPKRVVRAVYLAAKLGFEVEADIITWVKANHELINKEVSAGFAKKKLSSAAEKDIQKTIRLLDQMDLWKVVAVPMNLLAAKFGVKT
jgi:tRNA nucleotidyltransferase (CCA-adding enzyme)